jgi:hypothetical protein
MAAAAAAAGKNQKKWAITIKVRATRGRNHFIMTATFSSLPEAIFDRENVARTQLGFDLSPST